MTARAAGASSRPIDSVFRALVRSDAPPRAGTVEQEPGLRQRPRPSRSTWPFPRSSSTCAFWKAADWCAPARPAASGPTTSRPAPDAGGALARPAAHVVGAPPGSARRLSHPAQGETQHDRPRIKPDPKLDLVLERVVDVPRELVWAAWTKPEHLTQWFTPRPGPSGLRDRSAPGRHLPNRHAFAGGKGVPESSAATWKSFRTSDWSGPTHSCPDIARRKSRSHRDRDAGSPQGKGRGTPRPPPPRRGRPKEARGDGLLPRLGQALDQLVAHVKTM